MVIAVSARFLLTDNLEGYGYFIKEVFSRVARLHPEHRFYFLFDRPYANSFITETNITPLVISPPARHPFLWKYWYDIKVATALKKIKADVFVAPDGFASLTTKVPQCIVVHDLGFLHHPEAYKKSHVLFYKYYTPKFLKKAKVVATVSRFSKADIIKQYGIEPSKINVVYSAAKEIFQPAGQEQQQHIREKYTEGKSCFIYVGAVQPRKNLVNLLKAFSIFKKRQKSNMRLVITGRLAWKNNGFLQLLKTYKFRNDVVLTGYMAEKDLVDLVSAAYALVYPSFFEGFGVPVLEAMQCNIPVLTSQNTSMQEIAAEAALYFNPADPADIADKLMLIYKDETLRSRLIEKGKSIVQQYSWQQTAALMWTCITEAGTN